MSAVFRGAENIQLYFQLIIWLKLLWCTQRLLNNKAVSPLEWPEQCSSMSAGQTGLLTNMCPAHSPLSKTAMHAHRKHGKQVHLWEGTRGARGITLAWLHLCNKHCLCVCVSLCLCVLPVQRRGVGCLTMPPGLGWAVWWSELDSDWTSLMAGCRWRQGRGSQTNCVHRHWVKYEAQSDLTAEVWSSELWMWAAQHDTH